VLMIIPCDVDKVIFRTERDKAVGSEQAIWDVSPFQAAVPTEKSLLHACIAQVTGEQSYGYYEAPHGSNENKLSDRRRKRAVPWISMLKFSWEIFSPVGGWLERLVR